MGAGSHETFDTVFEEVRVFDGVAVLEGAKHVGVKEGRVAAISDLPLKGRSVIAGEGGWLLPGLIDSHIHLFDFFNVTNAELMQRYHVEGLPTVLRAYLDHGFTTIKSLGDPTDDVLEARRKISEGAIEGPRLFLTGPGITAPGGHPAVTVYGRNPWYRRRAAGEVGSSEEMRELVAQLAERGVDAIKLLQQGSCPCNGEPEYKFKGEVAILRLRPRVLEAGIDEAHRHGLRVTVHTHEEDRAIECLEAGADGLEHGVVGAKFETDRVPELLLRNGATYIPTLWMYDNEATRYNLLAVQRAGAKVILGSDSYLGKGEPGQNSVVELERMVGAGLTPIEALRAATSVGSWHNQRPDIGHVAVGGCADLLLIGGDPLHDISAVRHRLKVVTQDGRVVVDRRNPRAPR